MVGCEALEDEESDDEGPDDGNEGSWGKGGILVKEGEEPDDGNEGSWNEEVSKYETVDFDESVLIAIN
jgi:hypothetical protein